MTTTINISSIKSLPNDCVINIYIFLDSKEMLHLKNSCKYYKNISFPKWLFIDRFTKEKVKEYLKHEIHTIKIFHKQINPEKSIPVKYSIRNIVLHNKIISMVFVQ
jgi:hypothetical protein